MDPKIWGNLPDELQERIISRLPLKTILSFRSTCCRFNNLLSSPSFLSLLPQPLNPPHLLLLSHPNFPSHLLHSYDSSSHRWRSLSFSASHLTTSSLGLLCFQPSPTTLTVLNFLTRSSKSINSPNCPSSLTLIPSPSRYKILSTSPDGAASLYDPRSANWTTFAAYSGRAQISTAHSGAFFRGAVYFVTTPEPFGVVGFDVESGRWEAATAAGLPEDEGLVFVRLVGDGVGRRLMMVGGVGRDGISRSVRVWEMEEGSWREMGRLPEMMVRKFGSVCYHNYGHVYGFWHEGGVCVGCYTWPEVLMFRPARGTWHWLPRCPVLPDKWSCGFRWFSLAPDPTTLV
ncbi:F-box/kelch-repeat protein [Acorus gramineus]|uniref:F-box/kelch-repeat protein n=1 Tax=Acorus gramineus TaxID=55184 RepID=A0AAV9AYI5_ACOGR|nr:F-box/kelch-repeat protein [Acorus gramineus]